MSGHPRCRWCEQRHEPRYLCDPARRLLEALRVKGEEGNLPSVEFVGDPIPAEQLGLGLDPGDQLVRHFVVQAGTAEVAGVWRPIVIFTGQSPYGHHLPKWVYAGDDKDMARLSGLVADMTSLAVRRAAEQRG